MNLRTLISEARANGWRHEHHDGSFGAEHVWKHGDLRVGVEPRVTRDGETYQRLTIIRDGQTLVAGRVDSVDQAAQILTAYGLLAQRDVLAEVLSLLRDDYQTCRAVVGVLRRPTPTGQDPEWSVADRVLCALAAHIRGQVS